MLFMWPCAVADGGSEVLQPQAKTDTAQMPEFSAVGFSYDAAEGGGGVEPAASPDAVPPDLDHRGSGSGVPTTATVSAAAQLTDTGSERPYEPQFAVPEHLQACLPDTARMHQVTHLLLADLLAHVLPVLWS